MPFPTKYFPASSLDELGVFVQQELELLDGRLRLVPGLRYDRFALDADQSDAVFFAGNPGTPPPVDLTESAVSPRLGAVYRLRDDLVVYAQYAAGFRAPSYAYVNNGFSNFAFGYRTLPNPDLQPETSDNRELGARWIGRRGSLSVTGFDNRYDDFIEVRTVGVDPATGLLDFQARNVGRASIRGVEVSGDLSLGDAWRLRAAGSWMRGDDETEDRPLHSVPPPQLVAGVGYRPAGGRWGSELTVALSRGKDADRVDRTAVDQFAPPGYELLDLTAFYRLGGGLRLQLALRNLLDETYWQWADVVGQSAGSPVLDRYTSPGFNTAVTLRWSH
jgi:hemoglobin/transferrin/lactoferrin receptor protein